MQSPLHASLSRSWWSEESFSCQALPASSLRPFPVLKCQILVAGDNDKQASPLDFEAVPAENPMSAQRLLTHASGASHGFDKEGELLLLDAIYNSNPILKGKGAWGALGCTCALEELCDELGCQPASPL